MVLGQVYIYVQEWNWTITSRQTQKWLKIDQRLKYENKNDIPRRRH